MAARFRRLWRVHFLGQHRSRRPTAKLPAICTIVFSSAALACIASCGPRSGLAQEATEAAPDQLLSISQRKVDLGVLPSGRRMETTIQLQNRGAGSVKLSRVRTTCDCLEVVTSKNVLAPGERITATVRVDFTKDAKFTGVLSMEARCYAKQPEALAFSIAVKVKVE